MKREIFYSLICFMLIASGVLSGCQGITMPSPIPTPTPAQTLTPIPTLTLTPTQTMTQAPTLTLTPIPTPEVLTPIISAKNIGDLAIVDHWGTGYIYSAALSADGKQIAIAASTGVYIYDEDSLSPIQFINYPLNPNSKFGGENYRIITFSPDGKRLAFGFDDVVIWNLLTNEKESTISKSVKSTEAIQIEFSPDAASLAVVRVGDYIYCDQTTSYNFSLVNASTGKSLYQESTCQTSDFFFTFINNGKVFVNGLGPSSSSSTYNSSMIDSATGKEAKVFSNLQNIKSISSDGTKVTQSTGGNVRNLVNTRTNIIDLATNKIIQTSDGELLFLNDTKNRQLLVRSQSWLLQDNQGNQICVFPDSREFPYLDNYTSFSISEDKLLTLNDMYEIINIFDLASCSEEKEIPMSGMGNELQSLDNGNILLTSNANYSNLFDVKKKQVITTIFPGKVINTKNGFLPVTDNDPTMIAYFADAINDKILIYRFYPNLAYFIWNIKSEKVSSSGETAPLYPINVSLSPDGKTISYSVDNEIHFIDAETNKERLKISTTNSELFFDLSGFSSDSKEYVSFDDSIAPEKIIIYNTETGEIDKTYDISSFYPLGYISIEKQIAAFDGFALVKLDGTVIVKFEQIPSTPVNTAAGSKTSFVQLMCDYYAGQKFLFSPDFNFYATTCYGGDENYLRVWDVSTGKIIRDVKLPFAISDFIFSPDSRTIYTTSGGVIYAWQITGTK